MAIPPPILVLRHRSGGTMQPIRYQGATQADIGTAFGTAVGYNGNRTPRNHIVQFGGELFSIGHDGVYQKDDPTIQTGTWTRVYTYTATPDVSTGSRISGLYPVNNGGTASLMMVYGVNGNTLAWRVVTFDGTTWGESATVTFGGGLTIDTLKAEIIYRNQLHILGQASGGTISTAALFSPAGTGSAAAGLFTGDDPSVCVFNDRLFMQKTTGANRVLREFTGTWNDVATISTTGRALNYQSAQSALMTDGTSMFAFWGADNIGGGTQRCFEISASLSPTDITSTVLPSALTSAIGGTEAASAHWMCVYDSNTTPGSTQPWLYYAASFVSGTSFTTYQWNGNASVITVTDTGGDVAHSLPTEVAGGERIWTAGELDIKITGVAPTFGGETISFTATGDAGSADKTVTFQWTNEGEPTSLSATLTGAATGGTATRSGNSVINVDADGTTTYTAIWDTVTDSPGGRAQLTPVISA